MLELQGRDRKGRALLGRQPAPAQTGEAGARKHAVVAGKAGSNPRSQVPQAGKAADREG